jgi:phosphoribosyl-ATP pyrophosphohydrolase/phosphoribosyl-AMP cyclohydrolase/histidinol dehydrogenase
MTVIPARVAGVDRIWVASPRPTPVTLAAAWLAGADGLIAVGGAQAVAALAFGTLTPPSDLIVGPGNRWVTAAKKHLYGEVGIDFLAGPSEIVVIADEDADPGLVAADLLAQAEHDTDALPILICTSESTADSVDRELRFQLRNLSDAGIARQGLYNGYAVVVGDLTAAAGLAQRIAPEHLALHVLESEALEGSLSNYGSVFLGQSSAEAFADYGAGPNHVLPTGGTARFQAGLSVMTFLKPATWLELDSPDELVADTAALAEIEGLEAHAGAAIRRQR